MGPVLSLRATRVLAIVIALQPTAARSRWRRMPLTAAAAAQLVAMRTARPLATQAPAFPRAAAATETATATRATVARERSTPHRIAELAATSARTRWRLPAQSATRESAATRATT